MQKGKKGSTYIQILCTLSLFLLFAICSLFLISIGATNYKGLLGDNDKNFDANASLRYVSNKLHSFDMEESISIQKNTNNVFISLNKDNSNTGYHILIYFYNGSLYELFIQKDKAFQLGDGEKILEVNDFSIKILNDKSIVLSAKNAENENISSIVNLKCAEFKEEILYATT